MKIIRAALLFAWAVVPLTAPVTHARQAAAPGRVLALFRYKKDFPVNVASDQTPQATGLTFLQRYEWPVAGVALVVLEAALIAYLLVNRARRRRAEKERERFARLAEAEHRHLDEIVSNVPGIVWETSIDPATNKHRLTFISNYAEKLLGYTVEEWLSAESDVGRSFMLGAEDRDRVALNSEAVVETGTESVTQFRWKAKDGRILWAESSLNPVIDERGKVVGLRGVTIDVTEKKLAEEARRQTEERSRAILHAIPDLVFLQTPDGTYRDYHAKDPSELFASPKDFLGKNMRDVIPPELAEGFLRCFRLAEETGEPQVMEYMLELEKGEQWFEAHIVRSDENFLSVVRNVTERKQAEKAIRFQAHLLNTIEQSVIATDMRGVVIFWNHFAERLYGWSPEEAVGRAAKDLLAYEDSLGRAKEVWSRLREGEAWAGEFTLKNRRGDTLQIWVNDSPIFDERGNVVGVVGVSYDITERKRAEDALRESESRLRMAQQAARVGTWEWDLTTGAYVWSEMVWQLLGLEPGEGEATTERFLEHVHPEDRDRVVQKFDELYAAGDEYYDEFRIVHSDGRVLWMSAKGRLTRSASGRPERMLGVNIDITERKAADEALRQSEARFRDMADSAPVMIWVADTNKLCTYFNRQWLDFTGRSLEEELGKGWLDNVHPDDLKRCLEIYNTFSDHREPFRMEYRLLRADGAYRWVLDTGTPRFSSAGEFLGYIGSCVDITGQKQAEDTLQEMLGEVSRLKNQLHEENIYFQEEIKLEHNFSEIVGRSDAIKYVLHKIEQVAPTDSTVLILGETGTGKELVARATHSASPRRERPLIKVNCAALSAGLIESELFGHEKGAFTGATARKIGRFELAHGATLFLDEVGELPQELQSKLLRVIQEGEFERLGGARTIKADVRLIAATNRNLWEEVQKGFFREDLWYRLNVFPITVPPLRQRREDVPVLVEHFVSKFSKKLGKKITSVAPATLNALTGYSWPGNVRELANLIERAVINNSGPVLHLEPSFGELQAGASSKKTLEELERDYIIAVLDDTAWRIEGPRGAARLLGLHPSTLRTRMAKLKIQKPSHSAA